MLSSMRDGTTSSHVCIASDALTQCCTWKPLLKKSPTKSETRILLIFSQPTSKSRNSNMLDHQQFFFWNSLLCCLLGTLSPLWPSIKGNPLPPNAKRWSYVEPRGQTGQTPSSSRRFAVNLLHVPAPPRVPVKPRSLSLVFISSPSLSSCATLDVSSPP